MKSNFSSQDRRELKSALSIYGTSAFWRGNPMVISGLLFIFLAFVNAFSIRHKLAHHPIAEVLHDGGLFSFFIGPNFVQNCIQFYASSQVGASQAPSIPGLAQAEARAATIWACLIPLFFAAVMTIAGISFHDCLFFVLFNSIPALTGWYSSGQAGSIRKRLIPMIVGIVLFLAFVILSLVPGAQLWMVTRPAFLTVPCSIALSTVLAFTVLTLPNRVYQPAHIGDARSARSKTKSGKRETPKRVFHRVGQYELSQMLLAPSIPLSLRADVLASCIIIPLTATVIAMVFGHHENFAHAWTEAARTLVIMIACTNNWLIHREHWPILFVTGRFGNRLQFVRSVFKAALSRSLLTISLRTLSLVIPFAILAHYTFPHALMITVELIACITGLAFVPALAFLSGHAPSKGLVVAASFVSIFLTQIVNPFVLGSSVFGIATIVAVLVGGFCYFMAPRRISRSDWPFGSE